MTISFLNSPRTFCLVANGSLLYQFDSYCKKSFSIIENESNDSWLPLYLGPGVAAGRRVSGGVGKVRDAKNARTRLVLARWFPENGSGSESRPRTTARTLPRGACDQAACLE